MIINQDKKDKSLNIKIKNSQINELTTYHSIVTILEWCQRVHKVNSQKVLDTLKEKNLVSEHYYNPVIV